ncbi:hypothetical protein [Chryseolinea sp. H1M3-3]|uniref:hypothetical protein n=1 Tax=Chryseolinea sp. H1M3-3 TaxID=3034144 RepID=UPI0023ECBF02|nr:hypothetical protein [Chryseolinea sp. H1M3-3]
MKRKEKMKKLGEDIKDSKPSLSSLDDLQRTELSGNADENISLETSSTDEDEDEGLGDGNIGRSKGDVLGK